MRGFDFELQRRAVALARWMAKADTTAERQTQQGFSDDTLLAVVSHHVAAVCADIDQHIAVTLINDLAMLAGGFGIIDGDVVARIAPNRNDRMIAPETERHARQQKAD